MTFARLTLGQRGEELAVAYLQSRGYILLETNYRTGLGEIDCIFQDGDELVFVEVKTRSSTTFGDPLEAVGYRKWQQITRVVEQYLGKHNKFDCPVRLDVVGIILGSPPEINHIKNAFEGF
jgi:putative endonuclease